jgi:hypothetical protein
MNMIKVASKDVKEIILATFPGYKKRNVYICPNDKVYLGGLNWSGGSRSEYRACTITGRSLSNQYDMSAPAPWNNPFEGKEIAIPQGYIVVKGGHSCGKEATLQINVNPADMPRYLTQGGE